MNPHEQQYPHGQANPQYAVYGQGAYGPHAHAQYAGGHPPGAGPGPVAAPRRRKGPSVGLIVGLAAIPFVLIATCVGTLVWSGAKASRLAEATFEACMPSGDDEACGEATGTSDDANSRDQIRTAMAEMHEDFGGFVSLSPRGSCVHHRGDGTHRDLAAEVEFENTTKPMLLRWRDDELVAIVPGQHTPECE